MAKKTLELAPVRIAELREDPNRFRRHKIYLTEDLSKEYFETFERPDIQTTSLDTFHEVTSGEEGLRGITLLAYRYYQRVDLWWIIAVVNNIFVPSRDLQQGMVLRIPHPSSIARFIL